MRRRPPKRSALEERDPVPNIDVRIELIRRCYDVRLPMDARREAARALRLVSPVLHATRRGLNSASVITMCDRIFEIEEWPLHIAETPQGATCVFCRATMRPE